MRKSNVRIRENRIHVYEGTEDSPYWSAAAFAVVLIILMFMGMFI